MAGRVVEKHTHMKHILLFLLLPALCAAQKIETGKSGDQFTIVVSGDYMVQRDTSASGVITIQFIPSAELQKDLESRLGSVNGRIDEIEAQIPALQAEKKTANQERKEIEALLDKISGKNAAPPPPKKAPAKPKKQ